MIKRFFQMLREWKRGPVKQTALPPHISDDDTLGFSSNGFGAIGE
jgi:hypothetical protein